MNKIRFILLLILVSGKIWACECVGSRLEAKILNVEYIARIKVTKSKEVTNYMDMALPYTVEIQTIKQYRGNQVDKIYLHSMMDANCGVYLGKDSEWIIFGSKDDDGLIHTSLCSDNIELNKLIDQKKYPAYYKSYPESVKLYLNIFDNIDFKKISKINNPVTDINAKGNTIKNILDKINTIQTDKAFGLYKLVFDINKKVIAVSPINGFNKEINTIVKNELIGSEWFLNGPKIKPEPNSYESIIIIYHSDPDQSGKIKYYISLY